MRKQCVGIGAAWLLLLVGGSIALGDTVTISDGNFVGWSFSSLEYNTGSATASVVTGGNPGSAIEVTTLTPALYDSALGIAIDAGAAWNPATQGAITSVGANLDFKSISGFGGGQAMRLVVEQAGIVYGTGLLTTGPATTWNTLNLGTNIDAASFGKVVGAWALSTTEHPDFSASGSPVAFGFMAGNGQSGTYTQLYDNWSLNVTFDAPAAVPLPAAAWSGIALLGGLAVRQLRSARRRKAC